MRMRAALAAALLAAGGALVSAQIGSQATFRAEVNYVEVDVVVTDAAGTFVTGLTAADFELVDAGKPQTIETFHEVNVPIERADRMLYSETSVHPDVASNERVAEGRVYLIVLDDLHTSPENTIHVRRRAREFVERYVGSNDIAAVLHTSGRFDVSQDFTSNRTLLLKAIAGFMGGGLTSETINKMDDAVRQAAGGLPSGSPGDRDGIERSARRSGVLATLRNLSNYMGSLTGRRKAMVLFSEGMVMPQGLTPMDATPIGDDGRSMMVDVIAAATRANVHIYTVDASGLQGAGFGADVQGVADANILQSGLNSQSLARERRDAQGTLRTLASETGGYAIVNTNFVVDGFARILQDNSTYYLLGFYSTAPRDGKFHKLTVRAKRPGLQVKARAGYHAEKAGAAAPTPSGAADMGRMLRAAIPVAGLPMRVSMPSFKSTKEQAVVLMAVDVPADVFRFEPAGDLSSEDLELVYQVVEPGSKVQLADSQTVEMRLKPDTRARVEQRGFRVVIPVKVKPGRYQLRLAAKTKNGARSGSVFADLLVPDFFDERLVWSGASLTSATAAGVPTRPADAATAKMIPLMPSAARAFTAGDTLALYAEAYDNDTRGPHGVDLTAAIRDETGKVLVSTSEERSSAEIGGGRGGYGFRVDLPLKGLPPGSYVLTLIARSRASGNATATRDIPFAIS